MIQWIYDDVSLQKGIELLKEKSYFDDNMLDGIVTAKQVDRKGFRVSRNHQEMLIEYSTKSTFFRAIAILFANHKAQYVYDCVPTAKDLGAMVDCSRNAVITVATAKRFIEEIALLGYSYLELYTEDTITVEGEPYFGHLRGRLTKEEIQEMEAYGEIFGIELVPCIQTLAHLNAIFKWEPYQKIRDISDVLLAEDPRTYELLDHVFASIRKAYKSKRINIGMDEAYLVGLGQYRTIHGITDRFTILQKHLQHVLALCEKYDFKPDMWCDMFFRLAFNGEYRIERRSVPEEVKRIVPKNVRLVYWEYLHNEEQRYLDMLSMNKELTSNVGFATGAWKWQGFAPNNALSEAAGRPAFQAARKVGVDDILVTAWGDNGGECSLFSVSATFLLFGLMNEMGNEDSQLLTNLAQFVFGYTYEELRQLDLPDLVYEGPVIMANPSKYIFYNDLLLGLFDAHIHDDFAEKYRHIATSLEVLAQRGGKLTKQYETLTSLAKINSLKCFLAKNLKKAYDAHDTAGLVNIANSELKDLIQELQHFYQSFTNQWRAENKSFGLEVQEQRFGGLILRTMSVQKTILDYVDKKINSIPELEVERLPYGQSYSQVEGQKDQLFMNTWSDLISSSNV